jgi:hypothetical protein
MNRNLALKAMLASLIVLGVAQPVQANLLTFAFSGTVTGASVDNVFPDPSPFPQPPDFGTPFHGTYSFDPAATNDIPGDPTSGSYASPGGVFTLDLGGLAFSFTGVNIGVMHVPGTFDFYSALHYEDPTVTNTPTGVGLYVSMFDWSASSLVDNSQPLTPPSLVGFDTTNAFYFTDTINGVQVDIGGAIDTLTQVPEPPLPIVVALAAALAAGRRRRGAGAVV